MTKETMNRIIADQKIIVGKPVIKGTRIPVDLIIRLIAQGMTPQELLEDYPHLKKEDIKAVLDINSRLN